MRSNWHFKVTIKVILDIFEKLLKNNVVYALLGPVRTCLWWSVIVFWYFLLILLSDPRWARTHHWSSWTHLRPVQDYHRLIQYQSGTYSRPVLDSSLIIMDSSLTSVGSSLTSLWLTKYPIVIQWCIFSVTDWSVMIPRRSVMSPGPVLYWT